MVKTDRPHQESRGYLASNQLFDGQGWRLPSGIALSHFALRSGFLSSRLWDDAPSWGSRAVSSARSESGAKLTAGETAVATAAEPRQ